MLEPDHLPVSRLHTGETDPAPGHCFHLGPHRSGEIHATVEVQGEPPGPEAEGGVGYEKCYKWLCDNV